MKYTNTITEIQRLKQKAYADNTNLKKRQAIYAYTSPKHDIENIVLKALLLLRGEKMLDIGCGSGGLVLKAARLKPSLQLYGIDIAEGIIAQAVQSSAASHSNITFQVGDVQNLPFPDNFFDKIAAVHMLYHSEDISSALRELRRVLRPDGRLVITLNSTVGKQKLRDVKKRAARLMGMDPYLDSALRFSVEDGMSMLPRYFSHVQTKTFKTLLTLTDPQPYVDYIDSTRGFWRPHPSNAQWQRVLDMTRQYVQKSIDRNGSFQELHVFGVLTAT